MESCLNITSILLKKVILEADSDTWARIHEYYLSPEYRQVYSAINKYYNEASHLPSFEALKLGIRSSTLLDKVYAIEASEDVDVDNVTLLEFLKNEYTQEEILDKITKYLESSVAIDSAKESLEHLHRIIIDIEDKVELKDPSEDMSKIELFYEDKVLDNLVTLGLNAEYDSKYKFFPGEYILIGGRRGSGKSLVCANIAVNEYNKGNSSLYFTIEMPTRAILQRQTVIATGIDSFKIRNKNLSMQEWQVLAKWWANRFENGDDVFNDYVQHNSFDKLHASLIKAKLKPCQMDIIYDPSLTLAKLQSEVQRKIETLNPSVILVDYVNQIKRGGTGGMYDWTEQIEVSKALKEMANKSGIPIISPYQTDATGEARFAKGLLDSVDAAFSLKVGEKEEAYMAFECMKMRDQKEESFISKVDWNTLRIGPESAIIPTKEKKSKSDKDASKNPSEPCVDLPF